MAGTQLSVATPYRRGKSACVKTRKSHPGHAVRSQSILISGIGIAGPTLAYWLACCGFRPTLIEQAPARRRGGYIVDFWGLGYDIAEKMGLLPDLNRRSYTVKEVRFVDTDGHRAGGFGVDVFRKLTGGRYLSLPRSDLADAIYDTVQRSCETIFNDSIVSLQNTASDVTVKFERAAPRTFDLVIGADGLHSRVRSIVFGPESRFARFLGYAVAAFDAKQYRPRDEGAYVSFGLPGRQISRFAVRDDRTAFLMVFQPSHLLHDSSSQKLALHDVFGHAGWECEQILATLDRTENFYFDSVNQIRMERWSHGRVALVGDAAFAPSLLAGQGAALAMTAAYVLAGELAASRGQYQLAFRHYERMLRPFIDSKQKAAFATTFVPRTRLGLFVRNQLTKALRFPAVANVLIGRDLIDRLTLPSYPMRPAQSPTTIPRHIRVIG
jgi:2-polyprenyl-6-methoxyphenol hydroxylase-like FAD-dependent oxidoreductase